MQAVDVPQDFWTKMCPGQILVQGDALSVNHTAAAVYAVPNFLRSLTHDVCIISRNASL